MAHDAADLGLTFGVVEVGMVIAVFLTGVASLQAWNYFRDYPDDPKGLKALVGAVYIADTLHSVLLMEAVYEYTIKFFGQYENLAIMVVSSQASVMVAGVIAFAVQTYYCFRVYRITQSRVIASFCWVMVLFCEILSICISTTLVARGRWDAVDTGSVRWQLVAMQCVGAASDILIAALICASLLRLRSGFTTSDKLVDRLVAFTIGSGLLTSIIALAETITYLTMRNFVFLAFYSIEAKLFANSLLASLNERNSARRGIALWSTKPHQASTHVTFDAPERNVTLELTTVAPGSETLDMCSFKAYGGPDEYAA